MNDVTEKQAGGMWCPQVKAGNGANHSKAMPLAGDVPNVCIGSRCMMWRWIGPPSGCMSFRHIDPDAVVEPVARAVDVPGHYVWSGAGAGNNAYWVEPEESCLARRTGYCGLAGRIS